MNTFLLLAALLQDEGMSLGEILRGVPRDPAAIFVYLMLIGSGIVIWKGSRHPGTPKDSSGGKP